MSNKILHTKLVNLILKYGQKHGKKHGNWYYLTLKNSTCLTMDSYNRSISLMKEPVIYGYWVGFKGKTLKHYGIDWGGYNSSATKQDYIDIYNIIADLYNLEKMKNEKIICAAIKVRNYNKKIDGVYTGVRHNDCISSIYKIYTLYADSRWVPYWLRMKRYIPIKRNWIQGFMTNFNRFVDRKEAYEIALQANQFDGNGRLGNQKELISEDIY